MQYYTRCLNISVAAVYIDFKKAFPSISRQELVNRLQLKGLPSKLLNSICSSLSFNTTSLKFNGKVSKKCSVTGGTREGGILLPPEFNSVISRIWEEGGFSKVPEDGRPLPDKVYALGYADDIVCFGSSEKSFQQKLDWLVQEMFPFNLRINSDKSFTMIFNPANGILKNYKLCIEGRQLKVTKVFNHWGVRIRDDLAYIDHFDKIEVNVLSTAKRVGNVLFRLNITDLKKIRLYFNAFVSS
jgi:hypothetical protein